MKFHSDLAVLHIFEGTLYLLLIPSSRKNDTLQELSLHKPSTRTDTCENCIRKNWVVELEGDWKCKEAHLLEYLELWPRRPVRAASLWGLGEDTETPQLQECEGRSMQPGLSGPASCPSSFQDMGLDLCFSQSGRKR